MKALNASLPDDIGIEASRRAPSGFHARYNAKWREYRYRLWIGERQPLVRGIVAQRTRPVDLDRLAAIEQVIGIHDFASFAGGGEGVPWSDRRMGPRGTVRTVFQAGVMKIAPWWGSEVADGDLIEIMIRADGFLPRMVRNIVGAVLEIGERRREPEWIAELLKVADRRLGPKTAAPEGLTLWRVGYDEDVAAARP